MNTVAFGAARRAARAGMILLGSLTAAAPAAAQLPPVPAAIEGIDFLVGDWEGEGWIEYAPGQRAGFRGTERVERRMGGRLVVVEGDFSTWMGPELGDIPVHQALGIFSYDPDANGLVFRTYTAEGRGGASPVDVGDRFVVWGFEDPQFGTARFTITITEDGKWHEVGLVTRDGGASWHRFFEMTLAPK